MFLCDCDENLRIRQVSKWNWENSTDSLTRFPIAAWERWEFACLMLGSNKFVQMFAQSLHTAERASLRQWQISPSNKPRKVWIFTFLDFSCLMQSPSRLKLKQHEREQTPNGQLQQCQRLAMLLFFAFFVSASFRMQAWEHSGLSRKIGEKSFFPLSPKNKVLYFFVGFVFSHPIDTTTTPTSTRQQKRHEAAKKKTKRKLEEKINFK